MRVTRFIVPCRLRLLMSPLNAGRMPHCQRAGALMKVDRIAFVAADAPEAQRALSRLTKIYGKAAPEEADVVVALGGDGMMLQALHRFVSTGKAIYGMNRGSVGFLMNDYAEKGLKERLRAAEATTIR